MVEYTELCIFFKNCVECIEFYIFFEKLNMLSIHNLVHSLKNVCIECIELCKFFKKKMHMLNLHNCVNSLKIVKLNVHGCVHSLKDV